MMWVNMLSTGKKYEQIILELKMENYTSKTWGHIFLRLPVQENRNAPKEEEKNLEEKKDL